MTSALDRLLAEDARGKPAPPDYPGDHVHPPRTRTSTPSAPNLDADDPPRTIAAPPSHLPHPPDRTPCLTRLADVEAAEVEWLWTDRIPLGRITLVAGRPGCGKSMMTADWAARVSRGRDWPDGTRCPRGSVLLLAAEDDLADTIRPRLDAARADVTRVVAMQGIRLQSSDGTHLERVVTLADLDMIEAALDTLDDCRLIVIDPIGSYLGGSTDSHRDNEVRAVLAPLGAIAARRGIAVVVVCHTRKSGSATHADDAILGSVAFNGIARSVLHVLADPDDEDRRRKLLLPGKCNIAAPAPGWAFTVDGRPPAVAWGERIEQSADDMVQATARPGRPPEARQVAAEWLRAALAAGPRLASDVTEEARHVEDIAPATLRRARTEIGAEAYRPTPGRGPWWWRLPGQDGADAQ